VLAISRCCRLSTIFEALIGVRIWHPRQFILARNHFLTISRTREEFCHRQARFQRGISGRFQHQSRLLCLQGLLIIDYPRLSYYRFLLLHLDSLLQFSVLLRPTLQLFLPLFVTFFDLGLFIFFSSIVLGKIWIHVPLHEATPSFANPIIDKSGWDFDRIVYFLETKRVSIDITTISLFLTHSAVQVQFCLQFL